MIFIKIEILLIMKILINKLKIKSHEFVSNKTFDQFGMSRINFDKLDNIFSS